MILLISSMVLNFNIIKTNHCYPRHLFEQQIDIYDLKHIGLIRQGFDLDYFCLKYWQKQSAIQREVFQ